MNVRSLTVALGLVGAASFLGGCAGEAVDPPSPDDSSTEGNREVPAVVEEGQIQPNMIYIDKYGACADIPGTKTFICCIPNVGCRTGTYSL